MGGIGGIAGILTRISDLATQPRHETTALSIGFGLVVLLLLLLIIIIIIIIIIVIVIVITPTPADQRLHSASPPDHGRSDTTKR